MGSEQSSVPARKQQRAPPVRRGHTIAVDNLPETSAGDTSPGASVCSDRELPYISYTLGRPIGDSPKTSSRNHRSGDKKSLLSRRAPAVRRHHSAAGAAGAAGAAASGTAGTGRRAHDIVVVSRAAGELADEDIQRLQEIPAFLPIMRGTVGLPGARDPDVLEGLDPRPWVRMTCRLQAHLAACAQPIASDEIGLALKVKEADSEVSRLYNTMVEKQRGNARHAERLARVHDVAHQLARCGALLLQTLQDVEELNSMLPADKRLEPFVWTDQR